MDRSNSIHEQKRHGNFQVENGTICRSGILPLLHSSTGDPTVWHAQQGQNFTFDTNANDVQPLTSGPKRTQEHAFQRGMDLVSEQMPNLYGDKFVEFYNAICEDMPEYIETDITDSYSSTFGPLNVADYDICIAEAKDGVLVIKDPEFPNSISIGTDSLSEEVDCQMMEENTIPDRSLKDASNLTLTVDPGFPSNVMQYGLPPPIAGINPATVQLAQQAKNLTLGTNENDVQAFPSVFNVNLSCTSKTLQFDLLPPLPGITSAIIPDDLVESSYSDQGGEQQFTPLSGVEQISPADQLAGSNTNEHLLLEKLLTKTDVEKKTTGVLLPKGDAQLNFPTLSDKVELTVHDAYGSTWVMRLTVSSIDGGVYRLKDTNPNIDHYSLKEGDLLQIFLDVPGDRYVVKFDKQMPIHMPTELVNTATDLWRLIILKKLTKTDVQMGFISSGSINLGKRNVRTHFPKLQDKEGYTVRFVDCEAKRLWDMRLMFNSERAGKIYLLRNVREFLTFYSLVEGDMLEVLKSESSPFTYALRARKSH